MSDIRYDFGAGSLLSDPRGFARLGALSRFLGEQDRNSVVTVDLASLDWFDAHLASPMRVVIRLAEAKWVAVKFGKPKSGVETVLRKNGLLPGAIRDHHRTTMPVTEFSLVSGVDFSLYAKRHLSRREMPKMSEALSGKFYEGVDELFANASLHSKSECGITVCGQFYPRRDRLDFTLADGGRGIPGCIRTYRPDLHQTDAQAIDWAMQDYNTTRQLDIPGGLGSKILRDFIRLNGGKLIVVSYAGFWCQEGEVTRRNRLSNAFPGTAVLLEVNTADRHSYDLVSAPHPRDIW